MQVEKKKELVITLKKNCIVSNFCRFLCNLSNILNFGMDKNIKKMKMHELYLISNVNYIIVNGRKNDAVEQNCEYF